MTSPLEHLQRARAALIAFDPASAEESLRDFEMALGNEQLTPESVAQCKAELSAICDLAEAAREGVFAARKSFQEILNISHQLETYDRAGKRRTRIATHTSNRKF